MEVLEADADRLEATPDPDPDFFCRIIFHEKFP
jgi:hypothetical protein